MNPTLRSLLGISLPVFVLDVFTKYLAFQFLRPPGEAITVIPGFFNLVYVTNTGAAFGMFKDNNLFFLFLSAAALLFLAAYFRFGWYADRWSYYGAVLILPGVAGNFTDRLIHGKVIDFLDFHIGQHHWPAFNVADSAICVGAGLLIISAFRQSRSPDPQQGSNSS